MRPHPKPPSSKAMRLSIIHRSAPAAESSVGSDLLLTRAMRTLAGRGGMVLLSLAAAVSLARALGPAGRGQLAVLQSLAGLAAVLTNFAMAKAIVHRVGRRQLTLASAASDAFVLAAMSGLAGA